MLLGIGFQVAFPYMLIYVNHTIGVTKSQYAVIGGAVIVGSALLAIPLGNLADRVNRRIMLAISIISTCIGCFLFIGEVYAPAGSGWFDLASFQYGCGNCFEFLIKELLPVDSRDAFWVCE